MVGGRGGRWIVAAALAAALALLTPLAADAGGRGGDGHGREDATTATRAMGGWDALARAAEAWRRLAAWWGLGGERLGAEAVESLGPSGLRKPSNIRDGTDCVPTPERPCVTEQGPVVDPNG